MIAAFPLFSSARFATTGRRLDFLILDPATNRAKRKFLFYAILRQTTLFCVLGRPERKDAS